MDEISQSQKLFLARLATGLVQGLVLYLLYSAADAKAWPATDGPLFGALLMAFLYPPLVLTLSLSEMAWRKTACWAAIAALVLAGLGWCDVWQAWPTVLAWRPQQHVEPNILPSFGLFVFGGAGLFIAQALVIGGHQDGRFMARYPTHFDVAWKLAVQLALAACFTGAFWLLLWLGVGLFDLIKLAFLHRLIRHEWFFIPVTTLAVAGALHLTDIRPALVRGARTLVLVLLSWLLPLITLIVGGFLVSLPFTGLVPLFGFGHASGLLLAASAALIVLINAAHQDGTAALPRILQWASRVAAVLPLPLTLIASYALWLRIDQYGWTASRVGVAACAIVALSYAAGYLRAAIARGPWLARIEHWNFYVSLLILLVLFALFTPIASPQRIGVADQLARLRNGHGDLRKFDYRYLRWDGGRYGKAALKALAQDSRAFVRQPASQALAQDYPGMAVKLPPAGLTQRLAVYPKGATIPANFFTTDWDQDPAMTERPGCMTSANMTCIAILADLDGDGANEVILMDQEKVNVSAQIFRNHGTYWRLEGLLNFPGDCPALLDDLEAGRFTTQPPEHGWRDLKVGDLRLHIKDSIGLLSFPTCKARPH